MDDNWGPGNPSKWKVFRNAKLKNKEVKLLFGEHPHSRSNNNVYALIDEHQEPVPFDGHWVEIDIEIKSRNYLKYSNLSGNEIRKSVKGIIYADGIPVYEQSARDVQWLLLKLHTLIEQINEHSSNWFSKEERPKLLGRKIFYREIPCVIIRLIVDQGCIVITREDGLYFPPPVYDKLDDDIEDTIKTGILDPNIWWHRE